MGRTLGIFLAWSVAGGVVALALALCVLTVFDWRGLAAAPMERALGVAMQRSVTIAGPVRVGLWRRGPVLIVHDLRLANAAWGVAPDMLTVERVAVQVPLLPLLGHELRLHSVDLQGLQASVETDATGMTNRPHPGAEDADLSGAARDLWPGLIVSGPHVVTAHGVAMSYRGAPGKRPLDIAIEEARVDWGGTSLNLQVRGVYRAAAFNVQAALRDARGLLHGEATPVAAVVTLGATKVLVQGTLASLGRGPGVQLRLDGQGPNLRDVGALLGVDDLPEEGRLTFALSLSLTREGLDIPDLSIGLGSGTMVGTVTARPSAGSKGVDAEVVLASDTVDLELLQGHWGKLIDLPKLWSLSIPIDAWRMSHVDLSYQAQSVSYRDLDMDDVDVRLLLAKGILTLFPFAARVDDVPVDADLTLNLESANPEASLKLDTRRFPFGKALAASGALAGLDGPLDLSINLSGKGDSVKEIAATLAGTVEARLGPGRVEAALLKSLPSPLRGTWISWAKGLGAKSDGTGGDVPLDCATLALGFKTGRAEPALVTMVSGQVQVAGRGTLDLASGRLGMLLSAEPRPDSYLRALAAGYTVRLDGAIRSPDIALAPFASIPVASPKACALTTAARARPPTGALSQP